MRSETDSLGAVEVAADKLWGARTVSPAMALLKIRPQTLAEPMVSCELTFLPAP